MHCTMTYCRDCGDATGRRYATFCEKCRGGNRTPFSAEMDEELRRVYAAGTYRETGELGVLAKRWEMPRWRVRHRAQQLGIAAVKEPPWSGPEKAMLKTHYHLSAEVISRKMRERGFRRSVSAIVNERKRLRLRRSDRGYSTGALAAVMGVNQTTVSAWIRRRILRAERLESSRPAGVLNGEPGEWFIRPLAVRRLIIEHVAALNLRRADMDWLVDLLTNKAADEGERTR